MLTTCTELLEQITQHFDYLFSQYGFLVIHAEDAEVGEHCLIVLESTDCRVKFYTSQGEANLLFGTMSAPISWENIVQGTRHWYYIRGILNFLERRPLDLEQVLQEVGSSKTVEQQLAELSRKLEPVCDQVLGLFRKNVLNHWQAEYEHYEQEQEAEFAKRYEEWIVQKRS